MLQFLVLLGYSVLAIKGQVLSSFYESDRWPGFGIELLCFTPRILTLGIGFAAECFEAG